jgi:DNA topoisomerase VI subunit B
MTRTAFTTSRLLEFTTVEELTKLAGVAPDAWPQWIVKELIDDSLDACEDTNIAPEIEIEIAADRICVTDNGPGIAADTVVKLLDYSKKTSSREAYVGPSRGQQGNALQVLLAMPFVLGGGETTIAAHGVAHHITFSIDPVRREPKIERVQKPASIHSGTSVTVHCGRIQL